MAEYYYETVQCEITEDQAKFLGGCVMNMSGGSDTDFLQINYKKDFILTEEFQKMITDLDDVFWTCLDEWSSYKLEEDVRYFLENNPEENEESDEYPFLDDNTMRYSIENVIITKKDEKFFIELEVTCGVYIGD